MQGLIFIPDISGFTQFVKSIDMKLGVSITKALLNEIIESNPLELEISEIEGDAILFYRIGKPIPIATVFAAFKMMHEAFEAKLKYLRKKFSIEAKLSLKFIMHYGKMTMYNLKGFRKLYGQSIIESHRLLKNGADKSSYILITEDYIKALHEEGSDLYLFDQFKFDAYTSQMFSDLREISYIFFNYFPAGKQHLQLAGANVRA